MEAETGMVRATDEVGSEKACQTVDRVGACKPLIRAFSTDKFITLCVFLFEDTLFNIYC